MGNLRSTVPSSFQRRIVIALGSWPRTLSPSPRTCRTSSHRYSPTGHGTTGSILLLDEKIAVSRLIRLDVRSATDTIHLRNAPTKALDKSPDPLTGLETILHAGIHLRQQQAMLEFGMVL